VRQLPAMNELWRESQRRGDFTIVSVTIDKPEYLPDMRRILKKYKPGYPVLHCDDLGSRGKSSEPCGWHIMSVAREYWIDPQGNIITQTGMRTTELREHDYRPMLAELDWLKAHWPGLPIIALSLSQQVHDDGSVTLTVQVSNSAHTPLDVYVGGLWRWPRGSGKPLTKVLPEDDSSIRHVEFTDFGDYSFSIEIPALAGVRGIYSYAAVDYPGAEALNDGKGLMMVADREKSFDTEK